MEPRTWYHTIELPDGRTTPGYFDTRRAPAQVPWPSELAGGRCLDVGTFDGFWAFEMERRGAAEVVAIDLDDPAKLDWPYDRRTWGPEAVRTWGSARGPGFAEAAGALASKAKWAVRSVYELDPNVDGTFDVVFCGALLLHLRDPVLALERMRDVCRGALVLAEALDPQLELLAPFVAAAHIAPERDEWWRVNSAGLRRMVEVAGFRVVEMGRRFVVPLGPGAPQDARTTPLAGWAARRPRRRGIVTRALVARPRPPTGQDLRS
jgi:tRNA (mo5U34)-methyltransferase